MNSEITKESKIGLTKDEMLSQIEKDIEQQKKYMDYMVSLKGKLSSKDVGGSTTVTSNDLAEFHAKLAGDSALNVKAPDTGLTKNEMLNYIEKGVEQQKNNIDFLVARKEELSNGDPSCPATAELEGFLFYAHLTLNAPSIATKGYGNAGGAGVGTCVANGTLQGDLSHLNRAGRFEVTEAGVGLGYLHIQFFDDKSWTVAVYNGKVGTDASAFEGGGSWSFVHV
ncbi:hypothetical protein [Pseudofulvibacter geojedonensis]|uniref:Uncharacterized protein n=1 Tax=Pseudofulvibacter geojedonensis TaxID=1123758 RepID=A0ABW3I738_9FLAO